MIKKCSPFLTTTLQAYIVQVKDKEETNKTERIKMEIQFIEKDDNFHGDAINYWFQVDGISWGLSLNRNDDEITVDLLDCDGCPVEPCNDHDNIKGNLYQEFMDIASDDMAEFVKENIGLLFDHIYNA